jgi:hypothetical protein
MLEEGGKVGIRILGCFGVFFLGRELEFWVYCYY